MLGGAWKPKPSAAEQQRLRAMPRMTAQDVARHGTPADCWVVINGAVCNVTRYLREHPGGAQLVSRHAGKDCTADFEGMFHSPKARRIVRDLQVGVLVKGAPAPAPAPAKAAAAAAAKPKKDADGFAMPVSRAGPRGQAPPAAAAAAVPLAAAAAEKPRPWTDLLNEIKLDDEDDRARPVQVEAELVSRRQVWDRTAVYRLAPAVVVPPGMHVSVEVEGGESRPYTPISSTAESMDLLVRTYPDGAVSRRIEALRPGDRVRLSGPRGALRYRPDRWRRVAMVCGGTGITPMFQIAAAVTLSPTDLTRLWMVHACRTVAGALLRTEVAGLQARRERGEGLVGVRYLVSRPESPAGLALAGRLTGDKAGAALLRPHLPSPADAGTVALICGNDAFCRSAAAALALLGYRKEQMHVF